MPRISTYTPDVNVTKDDKLIGTDAAGGTKNFLIEDISRFIKETNAAGIAGQFNFKYKTSNHTNGCMKAISRVVGESPASFVNLSEIHVNKYIYGEPNFSIGKALDILSGRRVIIVDTDDQNNFGIYKIGNPTVIVENNAETDYFKITLGDAAVKHNGSLVHDRVYAIAIYTDDVNFTHHQNNASTIWNINHDLGKFPSVSIKFSSSDTVYTNVGAFAGVEYIDENNLKINLAAAESGYAYLN